MSDLRTLKLDFHWLEAKARNDGGLELKLAGMTVNGVQHNVIFKMAPSSIGYIAQDLHRVVADLQKELDQVRTMRRGWTTWSGRGAIRSGMAAAGPTSSQRNARPR